MTPYTAIPGWSLHAQAVARFEAWLRATNAGDTRLAALAANELRALGVVVERAGRDGRASEVRP